MPPVKTKTSQGNETVDETVKRAKALIAPEVTASELVNPPKQAPVTFVPQSQIPQTLDSTINNVSGFIQSQSENARRLQEEQQAFQQFANESSGFDLQQQMLNQFGVTPEKLNRLQDIQLQLANRNTQSEITKSRIAGAEGQTLNQAGREITQEDRERAIRDAGLASEAAVLSGNIETGRALARDAVTVALADRQFKADAQLRAIADLKDVVDEETRQLLEQEERGYQAEQARIEELKTNIAEAMVSGATQEEVRMMTNPNLSDEQKLQMAQSIVARGATELRNLDVRAKEAQIRASDASTAASLVTTELKQAELDQIKNAGNDPAEVQNTLANFDFLRNTTAKVIELSEGASPNPTAEFFRKNIGSSSTKNTQLQGFVDTLKANMLTLATDPSIKQFFGPQMSDADVRLMTAAGSNLRPDEQTPQQLKAEAERIDDWINRAQTAVREGAKGNNVSPNTITAPDGTLIEIID